MCGIAGALGVVDRKIIERMVSAQGHRGPDDHGIFVDNAHQFMLGSCRLSILDLSSSGHMPMCFADKQLWITYNGEIYNFRQLRMELEKKGYVFRSETDTEVVLNAYAEWGEACLSRLRGMFAFAVYDSRPENGSTGQLFLARDRFGIKPLYWALAGRSFLFASELKSLLASGLVNRQLDCQAIWHYLSLGSIPSPHTILANVSALEPGHFMVINQGGIKVEQYWDLVRSSVQARSYTSPATLQDVAGELRRLLEEATSLHMVADVPVGAFLSGGLDSTAIVGLMSQQSSRPLKTYSIGFEGCGQRFSELPWAKMVAERFCTEHTEIIVTGQDVHREFERLIAAIDQPSVDGINSYFVSQAARTGVTVALSGLGGDELFAGYPQFRNLSFADRIAPEGNYVLSALSPVLAFLPGRWRELLKLIGASPLERYSQTRSILTEKEKKALAPSLSSGRCRPKPIKSFYAPLLHPELDSISQTTYVETKGYLAHTLLRDTDAMSMAHSLEVRVPFLDHKLAEFAFSLPDHLKLNGPNSKLVLVEAVRDLVPPLVISRRKMGFQFPMGQWLNGPLAEMTQTLTESSYAGMLFNQRQLRRLRSDVMQGKKPYMAVWMANILIAWCDSNECHL